MKQVASALEREIAGALLAIGAVTLSQDDPFIWASGLRSPIYCDNRLTMAYPDIRSRIVGGFQELIVEMGLHPDVVAGTATAGIPHAAWLADAMRLPMIYVRAKPKEHGRSNQIEGRLEPGQRVVVIEDLISTGGSSLAVVRALEDAGAIAAGVLGIFSYGFPETNRAFEEAQVPVRSLTNYSALIAVAAEKGIIPREAMHALSVWHEDPKVWSDARE